MFFSIIIVNYNTKDLLKNCLKNIFNICLGNNYEVIIIDNNSCDGSIEMLRGDFKDKINLIINNKNSGFGRANNLAVKKTKGDYLFFLNSDTIINNDVLIILADFIKTDGRIGVVGPLLLKEDGKEQAYSHGNFLNLFTIVIEKFKKRLVEKNNYFEVDWVSGAALIVKKEIFEEVGGFDENFFMYFEDQDLCKRIKNLNYKIIVFPLIKIIHLGGKSIHKIDKRKRFYYQSQNYFFKKHYGFCQTLLMRFIRFPYKFVS